IKSVVDIALESSNVQKILATNNKVFIATEGKGLFLYDVKTEIIKPLYHKKDKIINSAIWDMILVDNTIWLGTNEGLYSLDITTLNLKKVDVTNSIIFSIQKDSFNRLWMGTDKGLMSYNLKTKYLDAYTKEEGVLNLEFNRRSSTKTQNGQFWFGGIKGITNFYPSKIKENTVIPKVHITKLNVITSDSTFVYNHREKKSVILPYNQNTISLEYVALNYTNSSQNKYKYQLVGRDKNWVEDNGFRFSRYVQLPPGKYKFKVIAANNDGLWNKKGDELFIEIMPPFWKTLWFQILIFITIAGVIYGVYYYRVKRLLAVERMKLRIASDLHDEVGSGLSSIALTSDILEQQYNKGNIKPHLLSRITKNARNLAATLDDIVWLINPEKETLGDFLMKSKTVSQELLNDTQINFTDVISDDDKKRILTPEQTRAKKKFVFIYKRSCK
ncbi:triple tyrosine motif-containing protein, partial [Polaribacter sp.]|uniref:triple tyrosine motif-containing protein n=1 Tax=Polaribacter sp. TaxID=1920175 RepID=UPI003F6A8234